MIIQSTILDLRKTTKNDLAFVLETETDLDNVPYIGQWRFDQHLEALANQDMIHLTIENKHGAKVGYVILTGFLDSNRAICIKRITNKIKGQGFGKEAMKLIIKWVFEGSRVTRCETLPFV